MTGAMDFNGQLVMVTGASSGLGMHFARTLARAGADLLLAARRQHHLEALALELRQQNARVHTVVMDVSDDEQVERALDSVVSEFGRCPTHLVNAAGVAVTAGLVKQSVQDWDRVLDTNLKGAWIVGKACAERWIASEQPGVIVNIASITGLRVAGGVGPYCASKAGLIHLTQSMALEWARYGIRVNALAPGYIETDLNRDFLRSEAGQRLRQRIPTHRFGQPPDLDGPLWLLLSEQGRYITGSVLTVDGGHLVSGL